MVSAPGAPFATPVQNGRSVRQVPPATQLYVLIYAQVYQSDGLDFRNALLSYRPAPFIPGRLQFVGGLADSLYGNATWTTSEIQLILASLTLDLDTPLSCLAVETLPADDPIPDPLDQGWVSNDCSGRRRWCRCHLAVARFRL